ncbi:MAG: alanine racemase [Treponema sp.]|jgi:alanine racemase|nr:alanine racemase [Treponema sp.]
MQAARAVIYLDNFRRNIESVRRKIGPHTGICVPVKADAYGHGALPIAKTALEAGAASLAVASAFEGAELRQAGINAPIFLFSQISPAETKNIAALNLIPFVGDRETLEILAAAVPSGSNLLEVHLKVDTGMGRLGCRPEEAAGLALVIAKLKNLKLGGIATHLAVSDSLIAEDLAYTKKQLSLFREAADSVREAGIDPGLLHAANSGALCFHEDAYFDMVRPGIFLYGYSPAQGLPDGLVSEPVMELRTIVAFIKKVRRGEYISYGRTWKAPEDTFIGTLPIGYADGLPRLLSNNHSVSIRGRAYPLAGRICMDQCMADLGTSGEVQRWDEAVIFGPGFEDAASIARKTGTISYEILCNINKRVQRVYQALPNLADRACL